MSKTGGSVDSSDVAHHSSMAKVWWDPDGALRVLRRLNPLRVQFIRDGLGDGEEVTLKGLKVLDAACGGGFLSEALALLGAKVTGVDASDDLIKMATHHAKQNPLLVNNMPEYICSTIEDHAALEPEKYDIVVASEILEHVMDHDLFIQACVQSLRPGGHIFITTPNRTWSAWWYAIVWLEYILGEIPRGTHHYSSFIAPEETTRILDKYNCSTKIVKGLSYSHLKSAWSWSSDNWYALQAQKRQ